MSQYVDLEGDGQTMSKRDGRPRDIPAWTAILAGSLVLGAIGAALTYAEEERRHTLRGYLDRLRYEWRS